MFGLLRGTITGRSRGRILVATQTSATDAVGYWVHTGSWQPTGEVTCYLYHQVREDINELFGFASLGELELFERLISVSGVGPKAGLALMSLGEPARIVNGILQSDIAFLSMAPGIGKKAAEKLVVELKNRLQDFAGQTVSNAKADTELLDALAALGYKPSEVAIIIGKIPEDVVTLDTQIRYVLKHLVK